MKTLQLNEATAKKFYADASPEFKAMLEETFTKTVLLPKITDRLKTVQDCFDAIGMSKESFDRMYAGLPLHICNHALLVDVIVPALNEGWKPDWYDDDEYKYYPYFNMDDTGAAGGFSYDDYGCDYTSTIVGARLVFKSSELAKYAGTQFLDVYRTAMTF